MLVTDVKLYLEDLRANGSAKKTQVMYEKWLNEFCKQMKIKDNYDLEKIKKSDIQNYRIYLEERGLSNSTINSYTAPVVSLYKFLYNEDFIKKDPTKGLRFKKVPVKPMTFLNEDEAKRLIQNCYNNRQKAMFFLMISTGMRIGEVVNLEMGDIKGEKVFITNAKRGETRYIPVGKTCLKYINNYIGKTPKLDNNGERFLDRNGDVVYEDGERVPAVVSKTGGKNLLFTSNKGSATDVANTNKELGRICKKAKIEKNISCHKLRSTAATLQSIHGTNIKNIQTMLGHQSTQMTARYVQMVDKNYQEQIANNGLW